MIGDSVADLSPNDLMKGICHLCLACIPVTFLLGPLPLFPSRLGYYGIAKGRILSHMSRGQKPVRTLASFVM